MYLQALLTVTIVEWLFSVELLVPFFDSGYRFHLFGPCFGEGTKAVS